MGINVRITGEDVGSEVIIIGAGEGSEVFMIGEDVGWFVITIGELVGAEVGLIGDEVGVVAITGAIVGFRLWGCLVVGELVAGGKHKLGRLPGLQIPQFNPPLLGL